MHHKKQSISSNSKPLVTLALFAFNQEKYIDEAVRSALEQDYSPLQIIISDDFSSDATYELIQKMVATYQGPHYVEINRNPRNFGLALHLNTVFEMARGEIIVVAAGDDICYKHKVSQLVQPMLDNESVVGVHSAITEIDTNGKILGTRTSKNTDDLTSLYKIVERSLSVVSQSHAFRKSVHNFFGPYNNDVSNEGKIMAFRESSLGSILYLQTPLTYYRIGSGVSTYQGTNVDDLTLREPLKVAGWHYSAIKQIDKDSRKLNDVSIQLSNLIARRKFFLENVYNVNILPWKFDSLCKALQQPNTFLSVLKAFLRTNAPLLLRTIYCRYFLSQN